MRKTLFTIASCLFAVPAFAGTVEVEKVHICCPACVKAIESTLSKAEGVTDLKVDKDAGKVTFAATDDKAGRRAFRSLLKAGFAGNAKQDGKAIKMPKLDVAEGTKANSVELTGVHLCCGGCVKAAEGALSKVAGVTSVKGNQEAKSLTITGTDVDILKAIAALREAGFNGTLKTN